MENLENITETVGANPDQPPQQPDLTVTDLNNIRAIIDVAVRRGAFGAAEASGVGQVFDKLNTFLNAVSPQKPEDAPVPPKQ